MRVDDVMLEAGDPIAQRGARRGVGDLLVAQRRRVLAGEKREHQHGRQGQNGQSAPYWRHSLTAASRGRSDGFGRVHFVSLPVYV